MYIYEILVVNGFLGNNFYGNDIREKLEKIKSTDEREAYILMDRVYPPSQVTPTSPPPPPSSPPSSLHLIIYNVCVCCCLCFQVGLVLKPKPPKLIMEPQLLVNEFGVYGIYIQ